MVKKYWFSYSEILKKCRLVNKEDYEHDPPTKIETLNNEKSGLPKRIKSQHTKKLKHHKQQNLKTNFNMKKQKKLFCS